jgi:hypothetical protein
LRTAYTVAKGRELRFWHLTFRETVAIRRLGRQPNGMRTYPSPAQHNPAQSDGVVTGRDRKSETALTKGEVP